MPFVGPCLIAAGGLGEAYTHTTAPRLGIGVGVELGGVGADARRGVHLVKCKPKKNGAGCPTPLCITYRLG